MTIVKDLVQNLQARITPEDTGKLSYNFGNTGKKLGEFAAGITHTKPEEATQPVLRGLTDYKPVVNTEDLMSSNQGPTDILNFQNNLSKLVQAKTSGAMTDLEFNQKDRELRNNVYNLGNVSPKDLDDAAKKVAGYTEVAKATMAGDFLAQREGRNEARKEDEKAMTLTYIKDGRMIAPDASPEVQEQLGRERYKDARTIAITDEMLARSGISPDSAQYKQLMDLRRAPVFALMQGDFDILYNSAVQNNMSPERFLFVAREALSEKYGGLVPPDVLNEYMEYLLNPVQNLVDNKAADLTSISGLSKQRISAEIYTAARNALGENPNLLTLAVFETVLPNTARNNPDFLKLGIETVSTALSGEVELQFTDESAEQDKDRLLLLYKGGQTEGLPTDVKVKLGGAYVDTMVKQTVNASNTQANLKVKDNNANKNLTAFSNYWNNLKKLYDGKVPEDLRLRALDNYSVMILTELEIFKGRIRKDFKVEVNPQTGFLYIVTEDGQPLTEYRNGQWRVTRWLNDWLGTSSSQAEELTTRMNQWQEIAKEIAPSLDELAKINQKVIETFSFEAPTPSETGAAAESAVDEGMLKALRYVFGKKQEEPNVMQNIDILKQQAYEANGIDVTSTDPEEQAKMDVVDKVIDYLHQNGRVIGIGKDFTSDGKVLQEIVENREDIQGLSSFSQEVTSEELPYEQVEEVYTHESAFAQDDTKPLTNGEIPPGTTKLNKNDGVRDVSTDPVVIEQTQEQARQAPKGGYYTGEIKQHLGGNRYKLIKVTIPVEISLTAAGESFEESYSDGKIGFGTFITKETLPILEKILGHKYDKKKDKLTPKQAAALALGYMSLHIDKKAASLAKRDLSEIDKRRVMLAKDVLYGFGPFSVELDDYKKVGLRKYAELLLDPDAKVSEIRKYLPRFPAFIGKRNGKDYKFWSPFNSDRLGRHSAMLDVLESEEKQ